MYRKIFRIGLIGIAFMMMALFSCQKYPVSSEAGGLVLQVTVCQDLKEGETSLEKSSENQKIQSTPDIATGYVMIYNFQGEIVKEADLNLNKSNRTFDATLNDIPPDSVTIEVMLGNNNYNSLYVGWDWANVIAGETTPVQIYMYRNFYYVSVESQNPGSGVSIDVSEHDINGEQDGVTPFTRSYILGTNVRFTAPNPYNGRENPSWTASDGITDQDNSLYVQDCWYDLTCTVIYGGSANTAPTASFTVSPGSGDTNTEFYFDASACYDSEDATSQLQVRWDWDGNGSWDTGYLTDKTSYYKYSSAGSYNVRLEVIDTGGLTDQTNSSVSVASSSQVYTITIQSSNPDSGVPIEVSVTDENGERDGVTPFTRTYMTGQNVRFTAPTSHNGNDNPHWETSVNGWTDADNSILIQNYYQDITATVIYETGTSNTPPTATFTVSPTSGDTDTQFTFDASGCSDNEDATSQLQVRWDWEDDGSWDTNFSTNKSSIHQYTTDGTQTIRLQVIDTQGLSDEATRSIEVTSTGGLTDIIVNSYTLRVTVWDHGSEDGDYIDLILNGQYVLENQLLSHLPGTTAYLNLTTENNTLIVHADNQGSSGSNTAKIEISDVISGESVQEWNLITNEEASMIITVDENGGPVTGMMLGNDGKQYRTIKIGSQWWMAENLKETRYRDGSIIPNVSGNSDWINLESGGRCAYDNNTNTAETYGYLYNWYVVDDSRNIAPNGWHIPTEEEWLELLNYLGGGYIAGSKMKEEGTTHWISPNRATNESGFSALPAGWRGKYDGGFNDLRMNTTYWSSTENSIYTTSAETFHITNEGYNVSGTHMSKKYGYSIRFVRNW